MASGGSAEAARAFPRGGATPPLKRRPGAAEGKSNAASRRLGSGMEQAKRSSDRRKYSRIATDQVISFAPVEARDLLGVSRDVSSGGIRFEAVGCEIDMGDVLRVTFNVGESTVEAVGKVVWSTEMDPITMDVGLEFISIDPEAVRLLDDIVMEPDAVD